MSYEAAEPESGPDLQAGRSVERQLSGDDRSFGDLMADIGQSLSTLMQQEVALAKAEVQQTAKRAGRGVGMYAGAGVAGHFVLRTPPVTRPRSARRALLCSSSEPMPGRQSRMRRS